MVEPPKTQASTNGSELSPSSPGRHPQSQDAPEPGLPGEEAVSPITTNDDRLEPAGTEYRVNTPSQPSADEPETSPYAHFQHPSERHVQVERIGSWILFGVLAVGGLTAAAIIAIVTGPTKPAAMLTLAGSGVFLLLGFLMHCMAAWNHKHSLWKFDDTGLEIRSGIWWKHEITIPRERVQHIDIQQGPLLRRYELSNLVVHTAGTANSTVELHGLTQQTAEALKLLMLRHRSLSTRTASLVPSVVPGDSNHAGP